MKDTHSKQTETLENLYIQAVCSYQQAEHTTGLQLHTKLRQLAPNSLYDKILTGVVYEIGEKFEEALAAYNRALEIGFDTYKSVFFLKANVLRKLQRYDEAIATLDEAIALVPGNFMYYEVKAVFLLEVGRMREVLAVYNTLLQKRPRSVEILLCKSLACFLLGQTEQSWNIQCHLFSLLPDPSKFPVFRDNMQAHLAQYSQLIAEYQQNHPQQADSWYHKGLVTLIEDTSSKSLDASSSAFSQAIACDPEHAWAWNGSGIVLMAQGRYHEAAAAFAQAVKLLPTGPGFAQNRKKAIRAAEGKVSSHTSARSRKKPAQRSDFSPSERPPQKLLEQLVDDDRLDEALQVCEQILSVEDRSPGTANLEVVLWLKVQLLVDLQRTDEAITTYRELFQRYPLHEQARSVLVYHLIEIQRPDQALEILATYARQEENESFYKQCAEVFFMLHRYQEALDSANHAATFDSASPFILLLRMAALGKLKRFDEALQLCEETLPVIGQNARAFPLLLSSQADLLMELNRLEEALTLYKEALRREKEQRDRQIDDETGAQLEGFGLFTGDVMALMLGGMGNAWLLLGDSAKALEYYDQALALGPNEALETNRDQALASLHHASDRGVSNKSSTGLRTRIARWRTFLWNTFSHRQH
jgi:tetratricopeptide (TPR) repeat protein